MPWREEAGAGAMEKKGGRTNIRWSVLSVMGCLVLLKRPVILGEEGKRVSNGCHSPCVHSALLGGTCVDLGDCPCSRRQEAGGTWHGCEVIHCGVAPA